MSAWVTLHAALKRSGITDQTRDAPCPLLTPDPLETIKQSHSAVSPAVKGSWCKAHQSPMLLENKTRTENLSSRRNDFTSVRPSPPQVRELQMSFSLTQQKRENAKDPPSAPPTGFQSPPQSEIQTLIRGDGRSWRASRKKEKKRKKRELAQATQWERSSTSATQTWHRRHCFTQTWAASCETTNLQSWRARRRERRKTCTGVRPRRLSAVSKKRLTGSLLQMWIKNARLTRLRTGASSESKIKLTTTRVSIL